MYKLFAMDFVSFFSKLIETSLYHPSAFDLSVGNSDFTAATALFIADTAHDILLVKVYTWTSWQASAHGNGVLNTAVSSKQSIHVCLPPY